MQLNLLILRIRHQTAPTPVSEASTSTINCRERSGKMRMGKEVKRDFNSPKALSAVEDHQNGTLWDGRAEHSVHRGNSQRRALALLQYLR
ncbi:unnamed protein product [Merluccius merluccius]